MQMELWRTELDNVTQKSFSGIIEMKNREDGSCHE